MVVAVVGCGYPLRSVTVYVDHLNEPSASRLSNCLDDELGNPVEETPPGVSRTVLADEAHPGGNRTGYRALAVFNCAAKPGRLPRKWARRSRADWEGIVASYEGSGLTVALLLVAPAEAEDAPVVAVEVVT